MALQKYYQDLPTREIGVDEAGRGPLFGRVYTAAVVLPKDDSFDHHEMKDSKKFYSVNKINRIAEYIKENATAWSVTYADADVIDKINIRQATLQSMHNAIKNVMEQINAEHENVEYQLLIDGSDFKPYLKWDGTVSRQIPHECIVGGDNTFTAIAAASILAKTERDKYIADICDKHPLLSTIYGIDKHKGYGCKKHMDAIKEHGISQWHRKSYRPCNTAKPNEDLNNI